MSKKNCWEFRKCGREEGGKNIESLGVCPAAKEMKTDGLNGGKNGGRVCWIIAGTFCSGKVEGTFAEKLSNCIYCDFYKNVRDREGLDIASTGEVLEMIK